MDHVVTAQETFRSMVRDELAPRLRFLGFVGSGAVYRLPDEQAWRMVGLQRSKWSDRDDVEFTVNLTVADKAGWRAAAEVRPYLGVKPSGNSAHILPGVIEFVRLGAIIPGHDDMWWSVRAGAQTSDVARDVAGAIETYGIPWLLREANPIE